MNLKSKICILVLVCDKYFDRMENIKIHLNNFPYDYFLIKAEETLSNCQIINNILTVNCDECYENLPKKVILALKYLFKNTDFTHFLKIDDDIKINKENLQKYIDNNFYNLDYLGAKAGGYVERDWHFGKCKNKDLNRKLYWNDYKGYWCGGGYGYILSRKAVFLLLKKSNFEHIYNEIYEDKAIGDTLREEGILPSFEIFPDLKISKKKGIISDEYIFISTH